MADTIKPPQGLGPSGRALWRNVVADLAEGWTLDQRERAILLTAAKQRDDLSKLEKVIENEGPMAQGSAGQPVCHPALTEARQGRLALGRLLGQISLPDEDDQPRTAAGKRGRKAANVRWDREAAKWGRARG